MRHQYNDDYRASRSGRSRDEDGRFMSNRGSRRYSEDDGHRGRSTPMRDDEGRFMSGSDYDDDYGRGRSARGHGGWFGDSEGHARAAEEGWHHRRGGSASRYNGNSRSYKDNDDRYSSRGGYDNDDAGYGHGGWFGDSEGHARAAELGWQHRRGGGNGGGYGRSSGQYGRSNRDSYDRDYD